MGEPEADGPHLLSLKQTRSNKYIFRPPTFLTTALIASIKSVRGTLEKGRDPGPPCTLGREKSAGGIVVKLQQPQHLHRRGPQHGISQPSEENPRVLLENKAIPDGV